MKALDEIKKTMSSGDTAKAAEALKEVLAKEPTNLQAKMLYGTCCQLLGDEETFRRIHDELAPEMRSKSRCAGSSTEDRLWERYHREWESMIALTVEMQTRPGPGDFAVIKYGAPPYFRLKKRRKRVIGCLLKLFGTLLLFWFAWWLGQKV